MKRHKGARKKAEPKRAGKGPRTGKCDHCHAHGRLYYRPELGLDLCRRDYVRAWRHSDFQNRSRKLRDEDVALGLSILKTTGSCADAWRAVSQQRVRDGLEKPFEGITYVNFWRRICRPGGEYQRDA
jgi:hypothetical protein